MILGCGGVFKIIEQNQEGKVKIYYFFMHLLCIKHKETAIITYIMKIILHNKHKCLTKNNLKTTYLC
jgi:hypothetical protein